MLAALDRVYASIVDLPLPWQAADVVLGEDGVVHLAWSIVAGKVRLRVHPDPSLHVWTYECVGTPRQEFIQESPPETWCAFVKKEFT